MNNLKFNSLFYDVIFESKDYTPHPNIKNAFFIHDNKEFKIGILIKEVKKFKPSKKFINNLQIHHLNRLEQMSKEERKENV